MSTDQKIVNKLKRAMVGEAPEFKKAAEEGIKEKKKYMVWERANPGLAAARPTAFEKMDAKIKRLKKNEGKKVVEEQRAGVEQESYLHLLAIMSKVVEEEEHLPQRGDGPSSSTAAATAPPTAPPGAMAGPSAKVAKPQ
ncbi:hypothetical protein CRE_06543 [Caenorhabditis remanei]|uniref:Uncharacterized protein n=1 Tax=Caenorhabditis remanei TaxID=31234 RepID=E3M1G8_CAERE|nr:hypothetical protein CRE_06543 [Caenorhabditis remanei]